MSDSGYQADFKIVPVGACQAAVLAALHGRVFEEGWDASAIAALLAPAGARAFVAEIGGIPAAAGFVLGRLAANEAEILTLAVSPDFRRRGIGRALVATLVQSVRAGGAERLFLEVAEKNTEALALYQGSGFAEAGRCKGYYHRGLGAPEDALVLALTLDHAG